MNAPAEIKIRLSPLSRLYFTLDRELSLDKSIISDTARYDRLLRMQQLSEKKRDVLLRNMLVLDAVALLLLFGKGIAIPGLSIGLSDVPAARETVTLLASLVFQFATLAYVNWHGYAALIDAINVHKSRATGIDPDFLSASDKFQEFTVKLYRGQMNIHGPDFAVPSFWYRAISKTVIALMTASALSFVCLHLAVVFVSARETLGSQPGGLLLCAYLVFLVIANLGGMLVIATFSKDFTFVVPSSQPNRPNAMVGQETSSFR